MHAADIQLTQDEIDQAQALLAPLYQPGTFSFSVKRFTPDLGPTTEVVTVHGRVVGEYARAGGAWVQSLGDDIKQGLYSLM